MSADFDKENIADGLHVDINAKEAPVLSPKKSGRKSRSKSIGPGGLDVPLKENAGNRRKSAFPAVAVKSILSREDEVKRREARRKSLAARRVSFAPEATLHTWDVVEYMRDATTSSASDSTRRASSMSQEAANPSPAPESDPADPPSTPSEQVEEPLPASSPEKQRDLHQKKRRRSSGIPPMNFNNPDDALSSSPYSEGSEGSDEIEVVNSDDDDDGSTMMSLDVGDQTEHTNASVKSNDSTGSSARLDQALRQAAAQATTQHGINFEEEQEDASMEIANDEITAAFKPWVQKSFRVEREENADPFSPAFKAHLVAGRPKPSEDSEAGEDDMSMDITRAMGTIIQPQYPKLPEEEEEEENVTMEFTTAIGGIQTTERKGDSDPHANLKRRRSSTLGTGTDAQGSPAKRPTNRRMSLRSHKATEDEESQDEATMDMTMAIGGIQQQNGVQSTDGADSPTSMGGDETMDFTMVVGNGIRPTETSEDFDQTVNSLNGNEDLSMEFTAILGGIKKAQERKSTPEAKEPVVATPPSKRGSAARFTNDHPDVPSPSPMKAAEKDIIFEPDSQPTTPTSPHKSPRRSARKSLAPIAPGQVGIQTPSPFANKPKLGRSPRFQISEGENATPTPQAPSPASLQPENAPTALVDDNSKPSEEAASTKVASLTDSIKLLSTPRKQAFMSPLKRQILEAPKKTPSPAKVPTPKKKTPTPRKSPRKQVQFGANADGASPSKEDEDPIQNVAGDEQDDFEPIRLQEFLELTNIRFMDLTTTKRRHTGFPAPMPIDEDEEEGGEGAIDLESCVVAAACTEPEYLMYQHACHELKRYISEGRNVVRQIEENTYEENPALFREYLSAPPEQRYIMDNQFKHIRTNARLRTKELWYGWRSNLLRDLKNGLAGTAEKFNEDDAALKQQEEILDSVLPRLTDRHSTLEAERQQLQQRADELNGPDREELDVARELLVDIDAALEEKKAMIEAMQRELADKETSIEAVKQRKIECAEEIKEADRVREQCRGWSVSEVSALKAQVSELERTHGWLITSASSDPVTLTMTYKNDLHLFFHPTSFAPHATSTTPNSTISLTYVGDERTTNPAPLTTTKRFFLQILRANLHCLQQNATPISKLLSQVKRGWDVALAVAENVRKINLAHIVEETILSDERMAVTTSMLLPSLRTKVKLTYEVGVAVEGDELKAGIQTGAEVVYGERYNEPKMREFLKSFVGEEVVVGGVANWGDAVGDLRARLIARGRKG
ncbi:Spc7-domain-containing protein [Saccharata proteae CBS 121410]|uniref:Spc7-domain-containing protein n=1 Tax=Saccharata proteae CBS 121410 TaxID=1314787 RepID=A0A9P4HT51_9PEZI|nr:Spc7-domain-containing protein [Saccharata proteae CBS 121410]